MSRFQADYCPTDFIWSLTVGFMDPLVMTSMESGLRAAPTSLDIFSSTDVFIYGLLRKRNRAMEKDHGGSQRHPLE